jgi:hypothetical protein
MKFKQWLLLVAAVLLSGAACATDVDMGDSIDLVAGAAAVVGAVAGASWGVKLGTWVYKVATKGFYDPNNKYHNGGKDDW